MSSDVLDACFRDFRVSALRLETLPAYHVAGEAERIAAWRNGQPRPERSVRTNAYLREVAADVLAGRDRIRIRVVDHPLSDYLRYQFAGYVESAAAGEEIRVAVRQGGTRAAQRDLAVTGPDCWVFDRGADSERVVVLYYDTDGRYQGAELADPARAAECLSELDWAAMHAIPLNEYLAQAGLATAAA